MRASLRSVWRVISWIGTITIVVGWVVLLRPQSLGGDATYVVIRGDSMEPAYTTGDLVIVRSAESYGVGDAVAYRVPEGDVGAGTLVIHRIVGGDPATGFILQGDNNSGEDPWHPRSEEVVGTAQFHIPQLGRVSTFVHQPIVLGGLASAIVVAWVVARPPTRRASSGSGTPLRNDRGPGKAAQSPS